MRKNEDDFSAEKIRQLAQSDAGRRLMAMLEGSDAANTVRAGAQSGDMEQAKRAVSAFLNDPAARALLKKLEEQSNG